MTILIYVIRKTIGITFRKIGSERQISYSDMVRAIVGNQTDFNAEEVSRAAEMQMVRMGGSKNQTINRNQFKQYVEGLIDVPYPSSEVFLPPIKSARISPLLVPNWQRF